MLLSDKWLQVLSDSYLLTFSDKLISIRPNLDILAKQLYIRNKILYYYNFMQSLLETIPPYIDTFCLKHNNKSDGMVPARFAQLSDFLYT